VVAGQLPAQGEGMTASHCAAYPFARHSFTMGTAMSFKRLKTAFEILPITDKKTLSSTDRLVYLCLANCLNDKKARCDPSNEHIAKVTALSPRAIQESTAHLFALGQIKKIRRFNSSNSYEFPDSNR